MISGSESKSGKVDIYKKNHEMLGQSSDLEQIHQKWAQSPYPELCTHELKQGIFCWKSWSNILYLERALNSSAFSFFNITGLDGL